MKIAYHPYELAFSPSGSSSQNKKREGALLRFAFSPDLIGFADCHPWVEFGDVPLQSQLDLIKDCVLTRLTERSLYFAKLDAQARANGLNLLQGIQIPESHYLVTDINRLHSIQVAIAKGFKFFKVKVGRNLDREKALLKEYFGNSISQDIKLRLDFNAQLSFEEFEKFLKDLPISFHTLDFCEDPFPYHPEYWSVIQDRYPLALAYDHGSEKAIADGIAAVLVLKPAVQDPQHFLNHTRRIVVTSYLDHPLGQVTAAYSASKICHKKEICGLLSHKVYQTNQFSECLVDQGPGFSVPPGYGFGFDEILQNLEWKELS